MRTRLLWNALIRAFVVCTLSAGLVTAEAQSSSPSDPLAPVARLLGRWTGTSEGQPGKGEVERQYERVLGSRFIQVRNRSTYPPQEKNPKGETTRTSGSSASTRGVSGLCFGSFTSKASSISTCSRRAHVGSTGMGQRGH
jgi:hypothetical protein